TSTCRANEELLLTRNSHLYRPVDLAGEIAGYGHEGIGSDARAEATARVLIDEAELVQFDAQHAGQRRICRALALQGAVEVAAPVFPVGHTGAGLQRMVRIARRHEGFFHHHCAAGKLRLHVPIAPFGGELRIRFTTVAEVLDRLAGPFQRFEFRPTGPADDDVAFRKGVGSPLYQTVERIDHEGTALDLHANALQRVLGDLLVDGGNR